MKSKIQTSKISNNQTLFKKSLLICFSLIVCGSLFAQSSRTANSTTSHIVQLSNQPTTFEKNGNHIQSIVACDTLNYPIDPSWSFVNYITPVTGVDGFVNGDNTYNDKEIAMYYDAALNPYSKLKGMLIGFDRAYSSNPAKVITIHVYDGTSLSPGAQIATKTLTMGQIMYYTNNNYYTPVIFPALINLPVSKKFFISVDVTGISWNGSPKDSLSIVSNQDPQTTPSATWSKDATNVWARHDAVWTLNISLDIFPFLTDTPYTIAYTQSPISTTNVCSGSPITFNASSSTNANVYSWSFVGGIPATSSTVSQVVTYGAAGSYTAKLYILGGGCNVLDSLSSAVNIIASPTPSATATPNLICPPNTTSSITATGGVTYVWTPSSSLSSSTGATVIATPTITTTYTVTATAANGCTGQTVALVTKGNSPVANVTNSTTTICVGGNVTFNASTSTNITTYSWVFPGGTPSTSSVAVPPSITYSSPGTFNAHLYASNNCGTDSSQLIPVNVGCVGLDGTSIDNSISTFFNHASGQLEMNIVNSGLNGNYSISIVNALGEVVFKGNKEVNGNVFMKIEMSTFSNGVYFVRMNGADVNFARKFIKE